MRKLVAALACRNKGSRLYGKPFQNLDIDQNVSILDNIIASLKKIKIIENIVLGVADGIENDEFVEYAKTRDIKYIRGDEDNVLERLICCGNLCNATDILRSTSESPFPYFDLINVAWDKHINHENDATFLDNIIDGCGYEILTLEALKKSHLEGDDKHRSELCSLYIRENKNKFKIGYVQSPKKLARKDIRLTVDYPEDLIVCRAVYKQFKKYAPALPLLDVVDFLNENTELLKLISPYCEEGYRTMYL